MLTQPHKLTLIASLILSTTMVSSAFAEGCPARPQGAKFTRAMLALSAANNCENLPYTAEEVKAYIETLKCDDKTRTALEKIEGRFASQFAVLFKGEKASGMCEQAKKFKLE